MVKKRTPLAALVVLIIILFNILAPNLISKSSANKMTTEEDVVTTKIEAEQDTDTKIEPSTNGESLEQAEPPTVDSVETTDLELEVELKGITDKVVKVGGVIVFLDGVTIHTTSTLQGVDYRAIVANVKTPEGGLYIWNTGDEEFIAAQEDVDKTYEVIYAVEKSEDAGETWNLVENTEKIGKVTIVDKEAIEKNIVSDDVKVTNLTAKITDGTPTWSPDDEPGNDSGPENKLVRTFDTLTYDLTFTTHSKSNTTYEHGRLYFEAELQVTADKVTFDTDAMGLMDTTPGYKWTLEEKDGKQILKWYYELNTTVREDEIVYPFPNTGTFPVHLKVYAMNNGDIVKPTFRASVAYTENGENKISGEYDVLRKLIADDVKVSAVPNYNIQLRKTADSYVGAISTFDFSTGNDTALNKDAGNVYGRLQGYGITIQLMNPSKDDGLKGVELPKGDITFDIDVSSKFIGSSGKIYDAGTPLIWAYGKHINQNTLNGRDISKYALNYLPGSAPYNGSRTGAFTKNAIGVGQSYTWNGGGWTATQNGSKISITIKDYIVNPFFFPSGVAGSTTSLKYYYDYEKELVQNIGCISGGAMYFVMPFGGDTSLDNPEYYPNKYNENSGSLQVVVEDNNLKMTSTTGQPFANEKQVSKTDDKISTSVTLSTPGTYGKFVYYTKAGVNGASGMDGISENGDWKSGTDSQVIGGDVGIGTRLINQAAGDENNSMYAYNGLLKFDDKVLDFKPEKGFIISTNELTNYESIKHLFAAKPDGTGWIDDEEMNSINEEDLIYYESLKELESDGKICVGILTEVRMPKDYQNFKQQVLPIYTQFKLKDDAKIAGKTYMITSVDNVWRKQDYLKVLKENNGIFPSRLNMNTGEAISNKSIDAYKENYVKAYYNETGYNPVSGGEPYWGDTLYVVPYKATIDKKIEQKDGAGEEKLNYDLSQGQKIVDFSITPKLEMDIIGESEFTTTVIIKDVIPKGMEYINGSSIFGGTYQTNVNPGLSGTVTGGTVVDPEFSIDEDGNQVLTWVIENQKITDEMPTIHYKASIDLSSPANTTYVNTATISTTEDDRIQKAENGNLSTAKVKVNAPALLVVKKTPEKLFNEPNQPIVYNLEWTNNATNAYKNLVFMDSMPRDGDYRGSEFTGYYEVSGIKVAFPKGKTNSNYSLYYTEDPKGSETTSSTYNFQEFTGNTVTIGGIIWNKAEIKTDGTVPDIDGKRLTGWVLLGNLESKTSLKVKMSMVPKGNTPLDKYVNSISVNEVEVTSAAYTVDRRVEGTVWIDENKDGKRDNTETLLEKVNVSLKIKGPLGFWVDVENTIGEKYSTIQTDEEGHYVFTGLPEGEFKVEFASSEGVILGDYDITIKNAEGVSNNLNSKADRNKSLLSGKLESGEITGITMPGVDEVTSSPYIIRYQDMGLIVETTDIEGTKTWNDGNNQDGKRPESITVKLLADGKLEDSKIVTASDNWEYSFTNLRKSKDGKEIEYTITEDKVESYETEINNYDITNTYTPETIDIAGTKVWDDSNNQDGKRPESIIVVLKVGEKEVDRVEVKKSDNWRYSFTDLPKYENGEEINYTVIEEAVEDYTVEYDGNDITNSYNPTKTSLTVVKSWKDGNNQDGKRPESVVVQLLADGVEQGEAVTLNEENSWTHTWSNLEENKNDGTGSTKIKYTVKEVEIPEGYAPEIFYEEETKLAVITNNYTPETVDVLGMKTWIDNDDKDKKRPESIKINLLANGEVIDSKEVTEKDNWKYEWRELSKYINGREVIYTVTEDKVEDYNTTINGYDIINNYISPNVPTKEKKLPKTGMVSLTGMAIIGVSLIGAGILMIRKNKK